MRKNLFGKTAFWSLLLSASLMATPAFAAEATSEDADFVLDPMVVTAQRYQTREVETPAAVEILDATKIKAIGANSVQETLKYSLGTNYSTYGPGGNSQSSMTSSINIRGVNDGTLVLLNGRPINNRGLVKLETIPVANVERIEVVRGGGSVLYGSEALGGVINIITKKDAPNSAYYEMGNFGQINTGAHLQAGKLGVTYNYRRWGSVDSISANAWASTRAANPNSIYWGMDYDGSSSNTLMLTYNFDDKFSLLYTFDQTKTHWDYRGLQGSYAGTTLVGQSAYVRKYNNLQNALQLNYNGDHLKANLFYNDMSIISRGETYRNTTGGSAGAPTTNAPYYAGADERNRNIGLDVMYDWSTSKTKYLVGTTYLREAYKNRATKAAELHRHNYSVYASFDHDFTDATKAILTMRYSWQGGNPNVKNLSKYTPQLQLSHKIGNDEYIYASAGTSYKYPSITESFGSGGRVIGNATLKPQSGKNYELGWKKNFNNHSLRAAFFHYDITDKISAAQIGSTGTYQYTNEDAKNTGVELEYSYINKKGFNYSVGAAIGDPKTRNNGGLSGAAVVRNGVWERGYDRYELNGAVGYQVGNWSFNMNVKYLFGRVHSAPSSAAYGPENNKPALYTNLNIRYKVDQKQEVYLKVENLFDRKDIVNNSSSEYYYTPLNFVVGYNINF